MSPRASGRLPGTKRLPGRPRRTRRSSDNLVAHPSSKHVQVVFYAIFLKEIIFQLKTL